MTEPDKLTPAAVVTTAIEQELIALGVPEHVTPRGLAKRTQIPAGTLRKAINGGLVPKLPLSGPRREVFGTRLGWAAYLASSDGERVWARSVRNRAMHARMTDEQFAAWYDSISPEGEVWVPFPASLGDGSLQGVYALSSYGRIRRLLAAQGTRANEIVSPTLDENGYPVYSFKRPPTDKEQLDAAARGEKARSYELPLKVYEAIAMAFLPKPPGKLEVLHSGPRHDSNIRYLRWGTRAENMGEVEPMCGEENPAARHTAAEVMKVLDLKATGQKQCSIAKQLRMDESTVCDILSGRKWRTVTGLPMKPVRVRPTGEIRIRVAAQLRQGLPPAQVAAAVGVSTGFAWKVRQKLIEAGEINPAVVGKVRKHKTRITRAMAERWAGMLQDGMTYEEIGRAEGRPASSVHYAVKKFNFGPHNAD